MYKTTQEIYDEILDYVKKEGSTFKTWYAGITGDIEKRLHSEHNVPKSSSWWIWGKASSAIAARNIEEALLKLGMDGGTGGGDETSCYVYCYKKTATTEP